MIAIPLEYLTSDHANAFKIRDRFFRGQEILSVARTENRQVSQCYSNVRDAVRENGGSPLLGWVLLQFSGHFIEAEFHAIWRTDAGELKDVTAPTCPTPYQQIAFIAEETSRLDDMDDPNEASWFIQLDTHAGTKEYIKLTRHRMQAGKRLGAMAIARGYPRTRLPGGAVSISARNDDAEFIGLAATISEITRKREAYLARFFKGNFARI